MKRMVDEKEVVRDIEAVEGGIKVLQLDGTSKTVEVGGSSTVDWDDIENKPSFATVATSGDYDDLTDKPTIPTNADYVDLTTDQTITGTKTLSYTAQNTWPMLKFNTAPNYNAASIGVVDNTTSGGSHALFTISMGRNTPNTEVLRLEWNASGEYCSMSNSYDNIFDIGKTNNRWKDLYLAGNLTNGTNSVSIADVAAGLAEANPTVPSGTTPTALTGLKVGSDYYEISGGGIEELILKYEDKNNWTAEQKQFILDHPEDVIIEFSNDNTEFRCSNFRFSNNDTYGYGDFITEVRTSNIRSTFNENLPKLNFAQKMQLQFSNLVDKKWVEGTSSINNPSITNVSIEAQGNLYLAEKYKDYNVIIPTFYATHSKGGSGDNVNSNGRSMNIPQNVNISLNGGYSYQWTTPETNNKTIYYNALTKHTATSTFYTNVATSCSILDFCPDGSDLVINLKVNGTDYQDLPLSNYKWNPNEVSFTITPGTYTLNFTIKFPTATEATNYGESQMNSIFQYPMLIITTPDFASITQINQIYLKSTVARKNISYTVKLNAADVDFSNLPTSDPQVAGRLWNDNGTLKISSGI